MASKKQYSVRVASGSSLADQLEVSAHIGTFASLAAAKKACKAALEARRFSYQNQCIITPIPTSSSVSQSRSGAAQMAQLLDEKLMRGFRRSRR
jgi:hypothetical protein